MNSVKEFTTWIEALPYKYLDLLFIGPTKDRPFTTIAFKTIPIAIINHNTHEFSLHKDLYSEYKYEHICISIEHFLNYCEKIDSNLEHDLRNKLFYFKIHLLNYKLHNPSINQLVSELEKELSLKR